MRFDELLRRRGLRQYEVAEALGISESWLSRVVHRRAALYPEQISRLALTLRISEDEARRLVKMR